MSKPLTALAVLALALLVAAPAQARPPRIDMQHAKHLAWDLRLDWIKANVPIQNYVAGGDKTTCRRVSRSVIDCTTIVLSGDTFDGCVDAPGAPGGDGCDPGERTKTVTQTTRTAWTMRYRAERWEDHYIARSYFPADRYASTNPKDDRFGGLALRVTHWDEP